MPTKKKKRKLLNSLDALFIDLIKRDEIDGALDLLEKCNIGSVALEFAVKYFLGKGSFMDDSLDKFLKRLGRKLKGEEVQMALKERLFPKIKIRVEVAVHLINKYKLPKALLEAYLPTSIRIQGFDERQAAVAVAPIVNKETVLKAISRSLHILSKADHMMGPDLEMASALSVAIGEKLPTKQAIKAFDYYLKNFDPRSAINRLKHVDVDSKVIDHILYKLVQKEFGNVGPEDLIKVADTGASEEAHQILVAYLVHIKTDPSLLREYVKRVRDQLDEETKGRVRFYFDQDLFPVPQPD